MGDGEGEGGRGAEKNQRSEEGDLVVEDGDGGGGEDSDTVGTNERGDAHKRVRQGRVG